MEEPGVPRLTWTRGCTAYRFNDKLFGRISKLSEAEIRDIFELSFGAWAEVDCEGRAPFLVEQLPQTTRTFGRGYDTEGRNEFVVTALTVAEWDAAENSNGAVALTWIWHERDTGNILDIDMELNLGMENGFGRCDEPCSDGTADLQHTVTHEAGHVFGLGHSDVQQATMVSDTKTGQNYMRTLEPDDIAGLCALELPGRECSAAEPCTCGAAASGGGGGSRRSSGCSAMPPPGSGAIVAWLGLGLWLALRHRLKRASRPASGCSRASGRAPRA